MTISRGPLIVASSFPVITVAVALAAVAVHAHDQLSGLLACNRAAVYDGELWRLLTGHFTHYSADHLLWDVVMFFVLGVMIERRHRAGFVATVLASATAITAAIFLCHPKVMEYRGLSGIDSALFTHYAIILHSDGRRFNRPLVRCISAGLLLAFAAKLVYETASSNTLFVDSATAGFVALPAAHLSGGITGFVIGGLLCFSDKDWKKLRSYFSRCALRCTTTSRISS
jgi:rhomboid family GlyGly-CTERM serine protease